VDTGDGRNDVAPVVVLHGRRVVSFGVEDRPAVLKVVIALTLVVAEISVNRVWINGDDHVGVGH